MHGDVVVVPGHRFIMHTGVGQRGIQPGMSQEFLGAGDAAACFDQLRGVGVPQAMRTHMPLHPFPGSLDPPLNEVFVHQLVAKKEQMIILSMGVGG